jgi:hypothetical protein
MILASHCPQQFILTMSMNPSSPIQNIYRWRILVSRCRVLNIDDIETSDTDALRARPDDLKVICSRVLQEDPKGSCKIIAMSFIS